MNSSELILNEDGSIYHLHLLPKDIANTIITVGDPDRVGQVSRYFDRIELKKGNREFVTHTGFIGHKRVSVISTGIGTDNIDIVLNELDALVNIDFETRAAKQNLTKLQLIRIGTSGTIQKDIPLGSILLSKYAIGLDTLMHFYQLDNALLANPSFEKAIYQHFESIGYKPYAGYGSLSLMEKIKENSSFLSGITITAPGFYAPQGRQLRCLPKVTDLLDLFTHFEFENQKITNLEMETAGIYALANIMGHEALSVNAILANRIHGEFASDPVQIMEKCIQQILEKVAAL